MFDIVGLINATSTAFIAAMAWRTYRINRSLVEDNRKLLEENKRLREAATEPYVVAYLFPDEIHSPLVSLVFENCGQGPALNVRFKFSSDEADSSAMLKELSRRTNIVEGIGPIPIVSQGQKIISLFGGANFRERELSLKVLISYKNLSGEHCEQTCLLDASWVKNLMLSEANKIN